MNLSNNLYENDAIRASLTRSVDRCNLDDDIPVPVPTSVDKIRTGFELLLPENYSCLFPAVVRERADLYCRIEFRGYIGVNQWGLEFLRELIRGGEFGRVVAFINVFSDKPYSWRGWVDAGMLNLNGIGLKDMDGK